MMPETIGESRLWTFLPSAKIATTAACTIIRRTGAYSVSNYMDLARKVAELQFLNRDHVLLFRGQRTDHRSRTGATTLKPSLFRPVNGLNPDQMELQRRFSVLNEAERLLTGEFAQQHQPGGDQLNKQQVLRWSILQHYEICPTPLLDVTHSLRIAASFASVAGGDTAFVFVIGVPNLSGAVTASAEAGVQIIRLSSVCPPAAIRPHIQEGYLLGEYPEMKGYDQKRHFAHFEIDFGRRLVAKFKFNPRRFWRNRDFPRVKRNALYPDAKDPIFNLTRHVKDSLQQWIHATNVRTSINTDLCAPSGRGGGRALRG
jgi:FRG domain-containing protein